MKAAKASEVAAEADKAFTNALTKADKLAKQQTAREAKKVTANTFELSCECHGVAVLEDG